MAWLPLASTTVEPARLAIARWASGGIRLSSVATRYQLGLVLHAGSLIAIPAHAYLACFPNNLRGSATFPRAAQGIAGHYAPPDRGRWAFQTSALRSLKSLPSSTDHSSKGECMAAASTV